MAADPNWKKKRMEIPIPHLIIIDKLVKELGIGKEGSSLSEILEREKQYVKRFQEELEKYHSQPIPTRVDSTIPTINIEDEIEPPTDNVSETSDISEGLDQEIQDELDNLEREMDED